MLNLKLSFFFNLGKSSLDCCVKFAIVVFFPCNRVGELCVCCFVASKMKANDG